MSEKYDTPFAKGEWGQLRHRINVIRPFVHHKEFVVQDLDLTDSQRRAIGILQKTGAIECVGREWRERDNYHGKQAHNKWQWDEQKRQHIKEYLNGLEQFPCCGQTLRVFNPRWADELACPGCETEYSKEWVRKRL